MESSSSAPLSPLGAIVRDLARQLVDYPFDLRAVETPGTSLTMLEISVANGDYGRLVGRGGANANALRHLISAISAKAGRRYILEIPESTREPLAHPENEAERADVVRGVIERLVMILVNRPEHLKLNFWKGEQLVALEVVPFVDDAKFILGTGGRTIDAIRNILNAVSKRDRLAYHIHTKDWIQAGIGERGERQTTTRWRC